MSYPSADRRGCFRSRRLSLLPRVDRPREKLESRGAEALSNTELLALLLGSGVRGASVLAVAGALLRRFGAGGLRDLNVEALKTITGIGKARASMVVAAVELGRRLFAPETETAPAVEGPESVFRLSREMSLLKKEHFVALYVNAKNRILKKETISIGSLYSNLVHPREVFAPALEARAAAVILVHNHPSGDPEPSPEDQVLTRRLVEAGNLLGIDVMDHLVIGQKGYVSFQERNLL